MVVCVSLSSLVHGPLLLTCCDPLCLRLLSFRQPISSVLFAFPPTFRWILLFLAASAPLSHTLPPVPSVRVPVWLVFVGPYGDSTTSPSWSLLFFPLLSISLFLSLYQSAFLSGLVFLCREGTLLCRSLFSAVSSVPFLQCQSLTSMTGACTASSHFLLVSLYTFVHFILLAPLYGLLSLFSASRIGHLTSSPVRFFVVCTSYSSYGLPLFLYSNGILYTFRALYGYLL